jgi:DNA-binding MarR family transcriptional regulator
LRAVLVDITPRGLAVHRESLTNRIHALATLLSHLSEHDRETLTKALAPLERLAGSEPVASTAAARTNGDQTP